VSRELYHHSERVRQESPVHEPTLRPWVKVSGRMAWYLMLALLALASFCEFRGF
jgi:hypothetical protein